MNDIFLTFDIDWACDAVIEHTLDILEERDIGATFFATHQTPVLERIRANKFMELGIHPNFNKTLSGEERKPYRQILDEILKIVPEAVCERAHALTHNSLIAAELNRRGILYDSNMYIPLSARMPIAPFYAPSGTLTVPFFFADDIYFFHQKERPPVEAYFAGDGLKVFDFHPIHIFLNAVSADTYQQSKAVSTDIDALKRLKNGVIYGASDFLYDVISYGKRNLYQFHKMSEIRSEY
ncbi:MAG: hypothetical protein LBS19_01170 [Clostridiales bacterium]|jgi:hypothetical protein|nr:hypothetical protein [Clostridiales bacterium]